MGDLFFPKLNTILITEREKFKTSNVRFNIPYRYLGTFVIPACSGHLGSLTLARLPLKTSTLYCLLKISIECFSWSLIQ